MNGQTRYDLQTIRLPRLTGNVLRLFVAVIEHPALRWLLLGRLLSDAGITKLRSLKVQSAPTFFPNLRSPSVAAAHSTDRLLGLADLPSVEDSTDAETPRFSRIRDYAIAYRSGGVTPLVVAERVLEAIKRSDEIDPPLRIFIEVQADNVMEQAKQSTQRFQVGAPRSGLDGVPVAIKDEVDMVPYGTTVGTRYLGKTAVREDSTVVARLREAGALLLGKANMYEIGLNPSGLNPIHGAVRNPYDPQRDSGGSSSGSAAAVAAGLCPLAIGADGGGSIRIPAAFCGTVGLKPTFGRVSEHGAFPLGWSVAHLGPIAISAEDVAIALTAIAGPDPLDPHSTTQPPLDLTAWRNQDLSDLILGIYPPWFDHADATIVNACRRLLDQFSAMGARIKEVVIPGLDVCRIAHLVTIASETASSMDPYYATHREEMGLSVRTNLALARTLSSQDYLKAQRVRTESIQHFETALQMVDAILTPSTAIPPPLLTAAALASDESDLTTIFGSMRFIFPSNFTGHPAISFPAGYTSEGLPIGIQAIGKAWEERTLLRLADAADGSVERKLPQVHFKIL